MLKLLLMIFSYASLLILAMPATGVGMLVTALFLLLGVGLIINHKVPANSVCTNTRYPLMLAALLTVMCLGYAFYNRWLPSSIMKSIAAMLHLSVETMLLLGTLVLSMVSSWFLYVGFSVITQIPFDTTQNKIFVRNIMCALVAAVLAVGIAQTMMETAVLSMGYWNFI